MNDDFDLGSYLDDLGGSDELPPAVKSTNTEKYPCEHCNGTGNWVGGRNRNGERKCFACKGAGYFKTSTYDRKKARSQRKTSQARKLTEAQEDFAEAHPDLIDTLRSYVSWNEFAGSLVGQFEQRGSLSDNQVASATAMIAKTNASRAAREEAQANTSVEVDLAPIKQMFEKVHQAGYRKPVYRADGITITRAPDHGRNAGALYVKTDEGDYAGKIIDNRFRPTASADDDLKAALLKVAADPQAAAVDYGKRSGQCACCGRALTNALSVELGIGPICRDNWF
jgi:hypothetical protein